MKRFLPALIALAAILPASAQIDPKVAKQCKDARDFVGCVKAFSTPQVLTPVDDGLDGLRNAMKAVSGRIDSGFSLRDSTVFFQPVTDQPAINRDKYPSSLAVKNSAKALELFNIVQSAWQSRINSLSVNQYTGTTYSCEPTKNGVAIFNSAAGSEVVSYNVKGGIFGFTLFCFKSVGLGHESQMLSYISSLLKQGSVSPAEIAAKEAADKEIAVAMKKDRELAALGPWNRHLEENPQLKKWVEANPVAAIKAKNDYIKKRPIVDDMPKEEIRMTTQEVRAQNMDTPWLTAEEEKQYNLTSFPPSTSAIASDSDWIKLPSVILPNGITAERYYSQNSMSRPGKNILEYQTLFHYITPKEPDSKEWKDRSFARIDCENAKVSIYMVDIKSPRKVPIGRWSKPRTIEKKDMAYEIQKSFCR